MSGESLNLPTNKLALETELEFIAMFSSMPETALDVREIIKSGDFYSTAAGKCYEYLLRKYDSDGKFIAEDMLNFVSDSDGEETLKAVKSAIAGVITFSADGVISRAKRVRQLSLYRQAQKIAQDLSYITPETVMDGVETSLQKLSTLTEEPADETMQPIQDLLADFVNKKCSGIVGDIIPTKYAKMDRMLPMFKSDLIIIAARPSVGKSAFAGNLGVKFAYNGYKTTFFSFEMSKEQLLNRVLSSAGQIPHDFLVRNSVSGKYAEQLGRAASMLFDKCMLYIDDKSIATVNSIKRKVIKSKAQVVIIDYLQLMKPSGGRKYASKNDEVSEITRDLKIMARDLNVVVILLSQLNREVDKRVSTRPVMSDLRDSGSIEQDANSIVFLSRLAPDSKNSDVLVDIAKNRSGETGQIIFQFDGNMQTFRETEQEYQPTERRERKY